jgi:hypothetical protein
MEWLQYYYTAKVVGIRSKRLGYLYYSVVLLIILYTIWSILVHKQYMAFEGQLVGAVNMRLRYDANANADSGYCAADKLGRQCFILDKYFSLISIRIHSFLHCLIFIRDSFLMLL